MQSHARMSRGLCLFTFFFLAVFCATSVFCQTVTHQWKVRKTSSGKESFLVALKISSTDSAIPQNNVHQVLVTLKPHCAQGTDLRFTVRAPSSTYDSPYGIHDFGAVLPETYTFNTGNGYEVAMDKTAGVDEWTLSIRFLPTSGNPNGFGCVGAPPHDAQSTVDFFIQMTNVAVPAPDPGAFMSKVDLEVGARTLAEYNAASAFGSTGLAYDAPPTIQINGGVLTDEAITAYEVPGNVVAPPFHAEAYAATVVNDTTDLVDNQQWQIKKPDSTTASWSGAGFLDFNARGFYELLYSVDEHVQSLFDAGFAPVQKAHGFVPVVVKYPPTAAVGVASPPVGPAPYSTGSIQAIVTHDDPLPEVAGDTWVDFDNNTTDATVLRWEIKKEGVTASTVIPGTSESLANQTITAGGKYAITVFLVDDYGIQGQGSADVYVQPIEKTAFPPASGVPFDNNEPDVDGVTDYFDLNANGQRDSADIIENGWLGATRLTFDNGTPAFISFQATRNRAMTSKPYLYMSFDVNNDPTFDDSDVIVLNFRRTATSTDPTDDRRIFIFPVTSNVGAHEDGSTTDLDPGTPKYGKQPRLVHYWKKDAGGAWNAVTAITSGGDGFDIKVSSNRQGGMCSYSVEIQVPATMARGGLDWMDIGDDFLFYFDAIRIDSSISLDKRAYELTWPRDLPIGFIPDGDLATYPFPVQVWGQASKGATSLARGVSLDAWNDIGTDVGAAALSDQLKLSSPNMFVARVSNTSESVVEDLPAHPGTYVVSPVAAANVRARFSIAHWGISYANPDWRPIPDPSALETIPAGAGTGPTPKKDLTSVWLPDAADQAYYASNLHQCIKVELDSTSDTNILKKGASRNMNFEAGSSRFSQVARISTRGLGKPPAGKARQTVILQVAAKEWAVRSADRKGPAGLAAGSSGAQGQGTDSYLMYLVNGYVDTGKVIIVNGSSYPVYMPIGSFGYVVHHEGEVSGWSHDIEGAESLGHGEYKLEIPAEAYADVVTTIESVTTGFSVSLHAGAATPLAYFPNSYSTGLCVIADVGYEMSPLLSFILFGGYNYLPGASSGVASTSIVNLALDVRLTRGLAGAVYGYVQAGPNLYVQDFSGVDAGYNAGLGLGCPLSPGLRLELGVDYHSTFSQHNWLLQSHAGIVLKL